MLDFANRAQACKDPEALMDFFVSQGQRMERELQQARCIQMSLLPVGYPEVGGWDFAATYESAREIGGDLYDFIEFPGAPERIGLLIADVSGKGTAATLFMAHSRAMIRGAAQTRPGPAATLAQANVQIARDNHAMLDTPDGRLTFDQRRARSAHHPEGQRRGRRSDVAGHGAGHYGRHRLRRGRSHHRAGRYAGALYRIRSTVARLSYVACGNHKCRSVYYW